MRFRSSLSPLLTLHNNPLIATFEASWQGHEDLDPASLKEHEEATKVKNINTIEMGRFEVDTWYFSPFPEEFRHCDKLYFCEFCLKFMRSKMTLKRHQVTPSTGFVPSPDCIRLPCGRQ